ncbi:hypothetical protein NPIRD3C_0926 [Nitrosopumilus piranensis]|uniref:Uncharacterized protein n=1 Tax=Nitrosopumilus piranensis TaxID=1582439 RepID=A0A0C5BQW5_9ARCH|nr:hypothetical protein NPIRD3C_0926 [Nitrosopumilus piranensis]
MEVNQDQTIQEEVAPEDTAVQVADEILEMTEVEEEDSMIEEAVEIVTAAAVNGNCNT